MTKSAVFMIALAAGSTPVLAKVQGLYGSDCLKVEGLSAYKDLAFDGDDLKQVQTVYVDGECQTAAYDFTFTGPYAYDELTGYLDYSFTAVRLTALDDQVAINFNHYQLCGINTWVTGEAQEVSGLDCGGQPIPKTHVAVFDRLSEQQDMTIRMSRATDDLDGTSAEKRPTELDDVVYHAK